MKRALILLLLIFVAGCGSSPHSQEIGNPSISSIVVTPANAMIAAGLTQQFVATATLSNGTTSDVTTSVTWTTSDTTLATINAQGLLQSLKAGAVTVNAAANNVDGRIAVTISAAQLRTITVSPASPSVPLGDSQQLTATGSYTDGSTTNLSSNVTWSSSNSAVAAVNTSGLVSSKQTGNATISATQ